MTGNRLLPLSLLVLLAAGGLAWLLGVFGPGENFDPGPKAPDPRPGRGADPSVPLPPRSVERDTSGASGESAGEPGTAGTGAAPLPDAVAPVDPDRPSRAEPKDPEAAPALASSGVVEVEVAGEMAGAELTATVFQESEDEGVELPPLVAEVLEDGRVVLPDLDEGKYTLEVVAEHRGTVVRERRPFTLERGKTQVALDPVRIVPDAGIRARAVDASGSPIPHAQVVVVREDEDPEQARKLVPGRGGWVLYGDLEPSNYHRVVALGLPRELSETVRTPNREGEVVEVELKAADRLVFCRVTLRLPEGAPGGSLSVRLPIVEMLRPDDRELQGEFLPGNYRVEATIPSRANYVGTLAVPATGPYEGVVDLLREE